MLKIADEMYSDLWVNSTKNDMEEYPEEFNRYNEM